MPRRKRVREEGAGEREVPVVLETEPPREQTAVVYEAEPPAEPPAVEREEPPAVEREEPPPVEREVPVVLETEPPREQTAVEELVPTMLLSDCRLRHQHLLRIRRWPDRICSARPNPAQEHTRRHQRSTFTCVTVCRYSNPNPSWAPSENFRISHERLRKYQLCSDSLLLFYLCFVSFAQNKLFF